MASPRAWLDLLRTDREGPGRIVVSVAIVAFLGVVVAENLPQSPLRAKAEPYLQAPADAGIEQGWGMFVYHPDPPEVTETISARLMYSDGQVETWRPPQGARFLGAQPAARWAKFGEFARPLSHGDGGGGELHLPLARWLARKHSDATHSVIAVELVAHDEEIRPIGRRDEGHRVNVVFFIYRPDAR